MEIDIRLCLEEDFEAVCSLIQQVHVLHINLRPDIHKDTKELITKERFKELISSGCAYVAIANNETIGYMEIIFRHIESPAHKTRDIEFINTMVVDKEYIRCGVGSKFFEKVKKIKKEKNLDGIELQVNAKNIDAIKMYKKIGFTEKSINMELLDID